MKEQSSPQKKPSRKKYIIPVVIILCIIAGLIYRAITWTPIDSKSKKASEAIIRQTAAKQLSKDPNNPIDPNELADEDFAKITELRIGIGKKELSDIKLLEKFTHLQKLYLAYFKFPEKEIPAWMKILSKLGFFNLSDRFSIDLSPLKKINNLQTLYLNGTQISNLEPLRNLTNLQTLYLNGTQVSNLKPLRNLTNLQTLSLGDTQVSNLEPLRNLTNLRTLELYGTQVSNIEPLKGLLNLKNLHIDYSQVTDIEPIKGLKNLTSLFISKTQISDLEPLKELTNLQTLNLGGTQVSDLEPLKRLKNLRNINIDNCPNVTDEQVEDLKKALPKLIGIMR